MARRKRHTEISGIKLTHAVNDFFLDMHLKAGYRKLTIPYLVMSDEKYEGARLPERDTSIVDLYHDRILDGSDLPILHCAVPAGSRQDQSLDKSAELLTICKPGDSYAELSAMTEQARSLLLLLDLPGRVMLRCTGRMPRCAAKTYSLEVWMPGSGRYVSVAEYTNCEGYLARRLGIRYRETATGEPRLCHTLTSAGLAVHHTVSAILENHLDEDDSVAIPECLQPYMHTDRIC